MKKAQSPLIIRPGLIRRLNTNSGDRSTPEEDRHKSNNPALSYITNAAKKVGGVFSVIFFGRKKADPASSRDQVLPDAWHYRAGQSPSKLIRIVSLAFSYQRFSSSIHPFYVVFCLQILRVILELVIVGGHQDQGVRVMMHTQRLILQNWEIV